MFLLLVGWFWGRSHPRHPSLRVFLASFTAPEGGIRPLGKIFYSVKTISFCLDRVPALPLQALYRDFASLSATLRRRLAGHCTNSSRPWAPFSPRFPVGEIEKSFDMISLVYHMPNTLSIG